LSKYVNNEFSALNRKNSEDLFSNADWSRVLKDQKINKIFYTIPLTSLNKNGLIIRNLLIEEKSQSFQAYIINIYVDDNIVKDIALLNLDGDILFSTFTPDEGRVSGVECYEVTIDYPTTITVGEGAEASSGTTWYS
ncbi:hypothetical protein, partial [Fulvivirga aurantia]|uniref:hypothetical protein n=1 Tax=Fulvivirga aurantia TaxID=2529383 RepID=UPI001627200C